ncbi:MAG: ATP-binding protein [Nostoc sp.]
MQRPQRETVTLEDILITEELSHRTPRTANFISENQALHALVRQLVNQPETMLQNLAEMALELCQCGTAGVSLLETTPSGEEVFRWNVLAGTLSQYVGGTTPRNFSPCGICLDRGTPVLFSHPERYFIYFQEANTPVVEGLVLPLIADDRALGTIWIISHDEQRHFDSEDVRVMTSLADFTAAALLLNQRQTRELLAANVALEAEIVERKQVEAALRESRTYFQSVVNLVPDMLWCNDFTGNTSWYNQRWLDYTGQTVEEAASYSWLEMIHPDARAQSLANFQNAVDEGRLLRQEHRIRDREGNYRWFLVQINPVLDAQGHITQWFGSATDIHEQKTLIATLRASEERLRLASEAGNFGTYEYIVQTDRINWSIALKAIHGLPEDAEISFERLPQFIHPDDREQTLGKFQQFLSPDAPGAYEHEFRIVRTDGAVRWVVDKGQVFFTGEGEHRTADRALGVTFDISERKLKEAALHESEERLRVMIENLPGGAAFVVDGDLRYLLAEGEALSAAGFKREDLVGKTIFEAMPPELTAKYEELYRMALAGESFTLEHNSHDRTYVSRGTPLRTNSGEVYAVLAVSYDISERKKAEVALRESEERFRLFVTASSDIIYRMSADWSQMHNLEGKNILANTEKPSDTWLETYISKEEQPQVWAVIQEAIRTKSTFELEHRVIQQDGTIGWTFSRAIPMLNEQGEIIEWFGAASDVTARKQTEAAIAADLEDTQRLRELSTQLVTEGDIQTLYQEIISTAIALTQADAGTVQILDEATQDLLLLATQGFERNMTEHFYRVNASSNTPCGMALKSGARTFIDFDAQESEDPDGSMRLHLEAGYLSAQSTPLITRSGKAIGMVSTHWCKHHRPSDRQLRFLDLLARQAADLIEQRQAQAALCESEAWLASQKSAFQVALKGATLEASLGVLIRTAIEQSSTDVRCAFYIADDTGSQLRHVAGMPETYVECVDGFKIGADSLTCGLAFYTGQPIITPDVTKDPRWKDWLWLAQEYEYRSVWSFPIETTQAKVVGTFTMYFKHPREVTPRDYEFAAVLTRAAAIVISQNQQAQERARAEAALRESEEKYRSLFNSMDEGYFVCDVIFDRNNQPVDLFYVDANPSATRMIGQNFTGRRLREIDPGYEAYWYEIFGRVARTGIGERLERYADPDKRWYDFYVFKVGDEDRRQVAVVFNDITDRKRAEEQIRRAAEFDAFRVKLSDALRSLTDPVEIQAQACRLLGEHLSVDRAYYVETNEAEGYMRVNQNYLRGDSPSLVGVYRLADYGWTVPFLQRGETIIVADAQISDIIPKADREVMAAVRIAAHITSPLIKAGRLVGSLCVTESAPREWSVAEVELVRETAERIWATIIRAHAETELRESEIGRVREQSAREQERQRAETLAELDRTKTLFFSNVSHEFRTPLSLILAPLQDALSDSVNPLTSSQRERLELAHRNSLRLLKLVNTLLDFSRIEAGRMEAVYEPTDLALFTTELASVFRSAIEQAGLRLVVDCPSLPEPVYVDQEMWEKIVLNLLSNAFKFTFEGEIAVRLYLADDHHVTLQVEDTGTGIAPEELPYLFERFYQVRTATARTHEGSGIGLALVQELIKLHGGTIDVSSTVGQGSCFTVTILLGTAHLPSVSVAGRDSARRLRRIVGDRITATRTLTSTTLVAAPYVQQAERWIVEEVGEQVSKGAGENLQQSLPCAPVPLCPCAHILLVDDNADMRDYLKRILSEHVEVEAVADGATALAAANERVPDLILSDVMMPGLDGFELLKALRADARTKEVPIILLSARAGEDSVIEGLLAGADDYLIKPFSATELVTRVNAYLKMAHLRSETLRQERIINRRKDEILSTVSHELNIPLVAILGWTRLLRSSPFNQAMLMKSLETIERNATLQAKLIEDLLDISRITASKISLNQEPVELQQVIETAIATVHQSYQTKDIRLECTLVPVTVQGDPERLQQIVLNLLTNAIKFTPTGGRIEVSLLSNENQAQIILSDTGCGIDSEFLLYIFDTFRQAEGVKKGLGLGLAIARNLVELHGGTIYAQSPGVGQGTTFLVKLPLINGNE